LVGRSHSKILPLDMHTAMGWGRNHSVGCASDQGEVRGNERDLLTLLGNQS
jgi:hypothetical protein